MSSVHSVDGDSDSDIGDCSCDSADKQCDGGDEVIMVGTDGLSFAAPGCPHFGGGVGSQVGESSLAFSSSGSCSLISSTRSTWDLAGQSSGLPP